MNEERRREAIELLKLASVLQFTVFGVPSVYYGDEAGVEGHHDPFCRRPFPWGREEKSLLSHYRALGQLRRTHPALKDGDFRFLLAENGCVSFERISGKDHLVVLANMGEEKTYPVQSGLRDALTGKSLGSTVTLSPRSWRILCK